MSSSAITTVNVIGSRLRRLSSGLGPVVVVADGQPPVGHATTEEVQLGSALS